MGCRDALTTGPESHDQSPGSEHDERAGLILTTVTAHQPQAPKHALCPSLPQSLSTVT